VTRGGPNKGGNHVEGMGPSSMWVSIKGEKKSRGRFRGGFQPTLLPSRQAGEVGRYQDPKRR